MIFIILDIVESRLVERAQYEQQKANYTSVEIFFNSILPVEFSGRPWYHILYELILIHHDWLCGYYPYNATTRDYRTVRWLNALSRLWNILLINCLFAGIIFVDDGSCNIYPDQLSCESRVGFNFVDKQCLWDINSDPKCSFNNNIGQSSFQTLLVFTLIVNLVTSCAFL
jgi:hypothetical protein